VAAMHKREPPPRLPAPTTELSTGGRSDSKASSGGRAALKVRELRWRATPQESLVLGASIQYSVIDAMVWGISHETV